MYLLQNNNWQASNLIMGLLTIIFITWLATVLVQYDEQTAAQKPEATTKQQLSKIVIEQLTLPPIPEPKKTAKSHALAAKKLAKHPPEPTTKIEKKVPPVNKQTVEQVYQQLSGNGGNSKKPVDIQIAWPRFTDERQAALDFMYQCVGVQFAVLNGNVITKIDHNKYTHNKYTHKKPNTAKLNHTTIKNYSDWIRVAQGSLSKNEQNWLNAFALTGIPVRLFPRNIDRRLARYLSNELKGKALVSVKANYLVTNQKLYLVNIYLNNQEITARWVLHQGKC